MKKTVDLTRSKRPMVEYDDTDLPSLQLGIDRIGRQMDELKDQTSQIMMEDGYNAAVAASRARVLQIVEKGLKIPLNEVNLLQHAEIRGQLHERFRLTKEIEGVRSHLKNLKTKQNSLKTMINRITEKFKTKEMTTNAAT